MTTDTPSYSNSSRRTLLICSMFLGSGTTTRTCAGSTPTPRHISSRRPRAGRVLTAGHTRCKVVRDDDHDIGARIDAIEQTRNTRVSEGRVAYDGYRRPLSGIGGTLGHGYRRTHFDAGMYRMERRQSAERIASYIAEYAGILILSRHLVQRRVHVAMTAAHAQGGRTRHDQIVGLAARQRLHTQSLAHRVGCKLAHARQLARQASFTATVEGTRPRIISSTTGCPSSMTMISSAPSATICPMSASGSGYCEIFKTLLLQPSGQFSLR